MKLPTDPPNVFNTFPRAGVDPITDETTAFGIVATQIRRPLRHETICMFLDHAYCGLAFVIVTDTTDPDDVIEVVSCLTEQQARPIGAIAIATVRPGADELDPTDEARWVDLDEITWERSVELLEWWIIGSQVMCPRRALGESTRWPADR